MLACRRRIILSLILAVLVFAIVLPAGAVRQYEGYKFVKNRPGYDKATCIIEKKNPTTVDQQASWVGLDNNDSSNWIWAQAGWHKIAGWTDVQAYYEYTDDSGTYSGVISVGDPGAGGSLYGARKSGTNLQILSAGSVAITLPWSDFDRVPLCGAYFGAEIFGAPGDYAPGSASNPCDFSSAVIREVGGSDVSADFSSANDYSQTPNGQISTSAAGSFIIWDDRLP